MLNMREKDVKVRAQLLIAKLRLYLVIIESLIDLNSEFGSSFRIFYSSSILYTTVEHTYAAVKERITLRKIPRPNAKTAFFSSPYENSRLMIPFPRPGRRPGRGKIFSLP